MKTRNRITACLCFVAATISLFYGTIGNVMSEDKNLAQELEFAVGTFTSSSSLKLPYRLLSPPKIEPNQKYPLVLFLHGAGERGADNTNQLVHVVKELARPDLQKRHPCFVLAPQCPAEQRWVEVDWGLDAHTMPTEPSVPLSATSELLAHLEGSLPIDTDRIYICGLSMGGFGTWDALQRHPKRFAAAIPMCGGGDPAEVSKLTEIPIWVFHGDADAAVKVQRSRAMVAAIQNLNGKVIYTEYPGIGHNNWTMTAQNRLVWDWLFAQSQTRE